MNRVSVDGRRFLDDLAALRSIGGVATGVVRRAFSDKDIEARIWIGERLRDAGLDTVLDPAGNLFGLPPGSQKSLLIGSHSDTQLEGGWLDGAFGVIAGLEVARASLAGGGPPVAVVSFQDEEGRFGGLVGSSIWSGVCSLEEADHLSDVDGLSFGDARRKIAHLASDQFVPAARFSGFIEPHIEQGPTLDRHGEAIGVVDSIVGIRQVVVSLTGEQNHAGTTPMDSRRDAFQALAKFACELNRRLSPIVTCHTVWTIGRVAIHPNGPSIIPGRVTFSVQWRDGSDDRLDSMQLAIEELVKEIADHGGMSVEIEQQISIPTARMDDRLVDCLQSAARKVVPDRWRRMHSGALHDASNVSRRLPAAMMFVPSIAGVSHSFAEDTAPEDLIAGVRVLAAAVEGSADL